MDHVTIQVDLDFETYKNQQRLRVKWINPGDAVPGGVKQASDDDRRAISNRLGSKFRANAGGVAVAVPKPATRPAPVTPKPPAGKQATRDEAWAAFSSNRHVKEGCATQDKLEATWFEIVGRMFPNRDADKLMTSDWSKFIATFEANLAPF